MLCPAYPAANEVSNDRYERTSLTQRMGFETRHVWHQTDWEAVSNNPEVLKFPQPAWLNGIDAGDYASRRCEEVVYELVVSKSQ